MSPLRSKHLCSHPGCKELTSSRFCAAHKDDEKRYDQQRGTAAQRGYDTRWHKVRAMKLAEDPLCELHLERGEVVIATLVHHIIPIEEGGAVLDVDNLMSLCETCHAEKHRIYK